MTLPTSNHLMGLGLRSPYYLAAERNEIPIDWFEVHSENFFHEGGFLVEKLMRIRQNYPISLHGVGLSLGSVSGPCMKHLMRLKHLIKRIEPIFISEHLSWSTFGGIYIPDLLPIPYNQQSFSIFYDSLNRAQDYLQSEILIENPSSYIEYATSNIPESEFLSDLCRKTGAKILLDVNNVHVSCYNHGWNALEYIDSIDPTLVKEIHLAGHSERKISGNKHIKIDTHDRVISDEVWDLYQYTIFKIGMRPTLIEWDKDMPSINILLQEVKKAKEHIRKILHAQHC